MLINFSKHTVCSDNYETEILLYVEEHDIEAAKEIADKENFNGRDMAESVYEYVNKNIPSVKNALIKIMAGSVVLCSLTIGDTENVKGKMDTAILEAAKKPSDIKIFFNEQPVKFLQEPFLYEGTLYVSLREMAGFIEDMRVNWDDELNLVEITKNDVEVKFTSGAKVADINDEAVEMPQSVTVKDKTMISLRFLCETFGIRIVWSEKNKEINLMTTEYLEKREESNVNSLNYDTALDELEKRTDVKSKEYSQEDLYWLSRAVSAEAQGEDYYGKLAVANVILNRVKSSEFPNTIKEVIFDGENGTQFQVVSNGTINNEPDEVSIQASKDALSGGNNAGYALFFLNPQKTTDFWIKENREFVFKHGSHEFYE